MFADAGLSGLKITFRCKSPRILQKWLNPVLFKLIGYGLISVPLANLPENAIPHMM